MRLLDDATDLYDGHSYPATTTDLIEAYGDQELELPNGTETLATVLGRLDDETFQTSDEARMATYSAVSDSAVGRVGYSDRDPTCPGEDGHTHLSL